jgi:hypothetical protein
MGYAVPWDQLSHQLSAQPSALSSAISSARKFLCPSLLQLACTLHHASSCSNMFTTWCQSGPNLRLPHCVVDMEIHKYLTLWRQQQCKCAACKCKEIWSSDAVVTAHCVVYWLYGMTAPICGTLAGRVDQKDHGKSLTVLQPAQSACCCHHG